MKKAPPPRSARHKNNPILVIGATLSRFLPFVIIGAAISGFYLLMNRKEQIHTVIGDAAIAFGLLVAVAIVLYLNPSVQQKFAAWGRARRDAQDKQFWDKREAGDIRQAEAQTRASEERARRIAAREARIAAATAAEAEANAAREKTV